MSKARHVKLKAVYDGTNITKEIQGAFKSFSYADAISGEADTVSITMHDREEIWMGDWMPERGATLELTLEQEAWQGAGDRTSLPLGLFEVDEIENSGPPNEIKLKAVSIPNNAEIRSVEKTRSWEKVQLSAIARDVAEGAGMELFYDAEDDPTLERAEQSEESGLSFLLKLCRDAGLALKVSDGKVVIFDVRKYEEAEPVLTVRKGESTILSFSAKSTINKIYKACHVKYKNSKKDVYIEHTFTAPGRTEGMTLEVNEKVETLEEAEKLAKKRLREKNMEEISVSVTMLGSFSLLSGNTVKLERFHAYDGKYMIVRATHDVGTGGYITRMDLRKCLDGY